VARYIYAATSVLEEEDRPQVQPRPVINGVPLASGFRWLALSPWWYFESRAALPLATPAPATYPNGTPTDTECTQPWCESAAQ